MSEPLVFNPFDRSWWADPYPLYERLLAEQPTGSVAGLPLYYFARYADCEAILRDARFGVDERKSSFAEVLGPEASRRPGSEILRSFLFLDPPDHTRLRGVVSRTFSPRFVASLREHISTIVDDLVAQFPDGPVDVVAALGYPLPTTVICELLAIPVTDRSRFAEWSRHLVAALDPELFVADEVLEVRLAALVELRDYMNDLVEERAAGASADLVSLLIRASDGGTAPLMTRPELLATLVLLLVAGYETTANLIANGVLALARQPRLATLIAEEPARTPDVVEEVLRLDPPVQLTSRVALGDVEVGGVQMPAGSVAIVLLAAANRDPAEFVGARDFDPARERRQNLSFSLGAHHCVGAPLARVEAELALQAAVARLGEPVLVEEPRYRDTIVLRGIERLVVRGAGSVAGS